MGWSRARRNPRRSGKAMGLIGGLLGMLALVLGVYGASVFFGAVEDVDDALQELEQDMEELGE